MNRAVPTRWIEDQDQLCLLYNDDLEEWDTNPIALIYDSGDGILVNTWTHGETGKYRGIDCDSWEDAKEEALDRLTKDGTLTPTQADVIRMNDGANAPTGFVKADQHKPAFDLIPPNALESIAAVLEHGARKYAADNWRQVDRSRRYPAAALRHIFRWLGGERLDKDSGLPHLAHAAASLLFACEIEHLVLEGRVQTVDDRPFSDTDWKVHRA